MKQQAKEMPQRIKKKISHKAIYLSDTEKLKVKGRKKYILVTSYQQEDSILLLPSNETDSEASLNKILRTGIIQTD